MELFKNFSKPVWIKIKDSIYQLGDKIDEKSN